eukprot:jgi/Chlat1/3677/Chrsp24S03858
MVATAGDDYDDNTNNDAADAAAQTTDCLQIPLCTIQGSNEFSMAAPTAAAAAGAEVEVVEDGHDEGIGDNAHEASAECGGPAGSALPGFWRYFA